MSNPIKIQLPDGSVREVPAGTTPFDIANSISPRLAAAVVVARITPADARRRHPRTRPRSKPPKRPCTPATPPAAERIVDLSTPLTEDVALELLKETDPAALKVVRHSAAHVMATAILELFPETKLGHGPATDNGFFYDVYREVPFTEADLAAIEARMAEVVARDEPFVRVEESRDTGPRRLRRAGRVHEGPLHRALHQARRRDLALQERQLHRLLPRPARPLHRPRQGLQGHVHRRRLLARRREEPAAPAHLRHRLLQRRKISTPTSSSLEEIKARDHRVLGKQLDLFSIQEVAGAGLIFWHPKGGLIRKTMEDWMRDECIRRGYQMVFTPHIMRRELWKICGHEENYAENMYPPMELDDAEYRLKPMNCPGHILIYKNSPQATATSRSATPSSATSTATSAPAPCTACCASAASRRTTPTSSAPPSRSKAKSKPASTSPKPSSRPSASKSSMSSSPPGTRKTRSSSAAPRSGSTPSARSPASSTASNIPYNTIPGEAAFYGPKIDIKLVDVLGRLWQLSTVQFDWNLPARFDLEYIGEDGEPHQPVMVHRALFGSVERFFGVLIEHYAGAFPMWLAPVQVGLVPISEKHLDYAEVRAAAPRSRRPARRARRLATKR